MLKRILHIAKKETISIFRDRMSMIILIALPLVIVGILGNVLRFELVDVKFAVLDKSESNQFLQLTAELDASDEFSFVGNLLSEKDIIPTFLNEDVQFVIFVPEDVQRGGVVQVFLNGSELILSEAIMQNISGRLTDEYPFEISLKYNQELSSEMETLPGLVMIAFIIVSSIMLSMSMNREREMGTARMLILTPAGINEIIAGKAIPYLVVSLIHGVSVYLLSLFMFGIEAGSCAVNFFLLTVLFSVTAMGIGLFIASLVKRELELLIGCWLFLFIPNLFFSGFIFPVQSMSSFIQPVASVIQGTLFIEAYKGIVFRSSSLAINAKYFALLALQAVVFYSASIYLFKRNFFRK